jgi:hypothetical protein
MNQSILDHEMLHADRSTEDEQLLIKQFFVKNEKYESGGWFRVRIYII